MLDVLNLFPFPLLFDLANYTIAMDDWMLNADFAVFHVLKFDTHDNLYEPDHKYISYSFLFKD